jgi:hypothetical protein
MMRSVFIFSFWVVVFCLCVCNLLVGFFLSELLLLPFRGCLLCCPAWPHPP